MTPAFVLCGVRGRYRYAVAPRQAGDRSTDRTGLTPRHPHRDRCPPDPRQCGSSGQWRPYLPAEHPRSLLLCCSCPRHPFVVVTILSKRRFSMALFISWRDSHFRRPARSPSFRNGNGTKRDGILTSSLLIEKQKRETFRRPGDDRVYTERTV